jgi:hypothetical protein
MGKKPDSIPVLRGACKIPLQDSSFSCTKNVHVFALMTMSIRAAGCSARSNDRECTNDHENHQSVVDWGDAIRTLRDTLLI